MFPVRVHVVFTAEWARSSRATTTVIVCLDVWYGYYFRLIGQWSEIAKNRVFIVVHSEKSQSTRSFFFSVLSFTACGQRVKCECDSRKQRVYCDRNDNNDMLLNSLSVYSWLHSSEWCPPLFILDSILWCDRCEMWNFRRRKTSRSEIRNYIKVGRLIVFSVINNTTVPNDNYYCRTRIRYNNITVGFRNVRFCRSADQIDSRRPQNRMFFFFCVWTTDRNIIFTIDPKDILNIVRCKYFRDGLNGQSIRHYVRLVDK